MLTEEYLALLRRGTDEEAINMLPSTRSDEDLLPFYGLVRHATLDLGVLDLFRPGVLQREHVVRTDPDQ